MAFTMSVAELIEADTSGLLGKHATWERVLLADVATILNGAPFDSDLFSNTEGKPLVRIRDVLAGVTSTYFTGQYEAAYLVQPGDLLIGMDGDFNSAFWASGEAVLNQRVCKLTPNEAFYDKRLLAYALPGYLSAINANTPSVTVKHLSSKTIGEIELPLPPRAEQTRIVAKLEELLSDLDAGVAELKAAQKKLQQYRQSLLKAAVEGALTADWREAQRQQGASIETGAQLLARILNERRTRWEAEQLAKFKEQGKAPPRDWQKKYPEPVQPEAADLPALPDGWVWASLDALISDGPQNGLYLPGSKYGSGTPILRIDDYQVGWHRERSALNLVDADEPTCKTYALKAGDLVINRVNSMTHLGKSLLVSETMGGVLFESNMMRSRLHESIDGRFITSYLGSNVGRTRLIRDAKWAVNQASINQQDVRRTPVPLPSTLEQQQITEMLDGLLWSAVDQTTAIELGLRQSSAQHQNILRAAFSGHLVPQDAKEESASALLKRIRTERAERANKPKARKTTKHVEA